MYTNVKQHCNCQSQNNFSTLNITLKDIEIDTYQCISSQIEIRFAYGHTLLSQMKLYLHEYKY